MYTFVLNGLLKTLYYTTSFRYTFIDNCKPTFETYELLFRMNTVAKLIIKFRNRTRVFVGLYKLINTAVPVN